MKRKINYIVEVNGRVVKSGIARVDFKKLQEFEREIIAEYIPFEDMYMCRDCYYGSKY